MVMRLLLVGIAVMLVACSERPDAVADASMEVPAGELTGVLQGAWPPEGIARVVGYRYEIPRGAYNAFLLRDDGDERNSRLHHAELARLTRASKELTPAQVERLLAASFSEDGVGVGAACYQPHHIFVFHAPDGSIAQAIEVCFECYGIQAAPIPAGDPPSADFKALALLCDELGLWEGEKTAEEYISNFMK